MGASGAFIAVSIVALKLGGPALLGALVLTSAMVQLFLAFKMSLVRRVITPTVGGTVHFTPESSSRCVRDHFSGDALCGWHENDHERRSGLSK